MGKYNSSCQKVLPIAIGLSVLLLLCGSKVAPNQDEAQSRQVQNQHSGTDNQLILPKGDGQVMLNLLHHLPVFRDANLDSSVNGKEYWGYLPLASQVNVGPKETIEYYGKNREVYQIFDLYDENGSITALTEDDVPLYALAAYLVYSSEQVVLLDDTALFSEPKLTAIDKKGRKIPTGTYVVIDLDEDEDMGNFVKVAYVLGGYVYRDKYIQKNYSGTNSESAMQFLQIRANIEDTKSKLVKDALIFAGSALRNLAPELSEIMGNYKLNDPNIEKAKNQVGSGTVYDSNILNFSLGTIPFYRFPNPYTHTGYFKVSDGQVLGLLKNSEDIVSVTELQVLGKYREAETKKIYVALTYGSLDTPVFVEENRLFLDN